MEQTSSETIQQLETALREARLELEQIEKRLGERPDFGLGKGNAGASSWEMAMIRRERVTQRIAELQEALERTGDGTYGHCEHCGKPINRERLEILPATNLCVDCARRGETVGHNGGDP